MSSDTVNNLTFAAILLAGGAAVAGIILAIGWAARGDNTCEESLRKAEGYPATTYCSSGARAEFIRQGDQLYTHCACPTSVIQEPETPEPP